MGALLFIITTLFALYSIILFLYNLARRQFIKAKKAIAYLGGVIGVYFIILFAVSFLSKSTILPLHENKCFDEWCAAVFNVSKIAEPNNNNEYIVTIKISNKGRGRPQRPDNPHIYAVDGNNMQYEQSQTALSAYEAIHGGQLPISQLINAGASFTTTMVFLLPNVTKNYLVITEGGWPTYFTIGDEGSFFHKESLTPLD